MLTSPRGSPAKSRARREEEKKKEQEARNRFSHPLQDVEMQDPPHDEGAAHMVVEVPTVEVARTEEVPAIEAERTRAEPSEGSGPRRRRRRPRRTKARRETALSPASS